MEIDRTAAIPGIWADNRQSGFDFSLERTFYVYSEGAMHACNETADADAVRATLNGDRNAFGPLVLRYDAAVSAVGRRMLRSEADVADFTQEVFLKAFRKLGQFSGHGTFGSWLMRIAHTTAFNTHRDRPPEEPVDPVTISRTSTDTAEFGPERSTQRAATIQAIVRAVAELPAHLARTADLHILRGLRYTEIARVTGTSISTLKSHVRRAKALLKIDLAGV
jgi:RNA polymerase sigma-70 factor (ECF subfamily)